ncbi:hypothetical protein SUGI_1507150 [Cryptomeria japonica]|uniref:C2 tensin-type domain-containing protein n=1 Tax=Cryptomeria japonica TaxID=3369 RepID=A0AAD3RQ38_CRYJA|nr:hypothetical protein SUGI_1507150 [Cryptomeria japonica]
MNWNSNNNCWSMVSINRTIVTITTTINCSSNNNNPVEYYFEDPLYLNGDIKIEFYQQKSKIIKKEKLFSFWFNTFFAVGNQNDNQRRYSMDMTSNDLNLVFYKEHLDKAYKDTTHKMFGEDFKVILKFKRAPTTIGSIK